MPMQILRISVQQIYNYETLRGEDLDRKVRCTPIQGLLLSEIQRTKTVEQRR